MNVDERTLVADVKSYIDELENFRAEVEEHSIKIKRMDLTVYYKQQLICTAEFKRPTTLEGSTPRNFNVVSDAYLKASDRTPPIRFFITSNFNETIVWDNYDVRKPLMARDVYSIYLDKKIRNDPDFEDDKVKEDIKTKMQELALYIKDLVEGVRKAQYKALDESFILGLNAHLESAASISKRYVPQKILQKWWKEQGYLPKLSFDDSDKEKIAKHSLYVLANKIVFYYVLSRIFPGIKQIDADKNNISDLKVELDYCFKDARKISGDYETVFEESEADLIPFEKEENLNSLRALIKFLKDYDFTKLPQDLLGNIYDRLISPEERHANGQYYTPIPVVDLINALTIRKPDARVMDPACGSGTFLTRAFDLKLSLHMQDNETTREEIMKEIFGCDIAPYPAHLATVALASKLLMYNPDYYPNILKSDFLDIKTRNVIPKERLPTEEKSEFTTTSLKGQQKPVSFKPIDAFVGNLPYIRHEEIQNKDEELEKVKTFLNENAFFNNIKKGEEFFYIPDAYSDFHIYFWYYLLPFLKEGSLVGFLTSDTWMNVEYGQGFKKFLNRYFKIRYIIDSSVERWFDDALVNTVITILERTDNKEDRQDNMIKFVRINKNTSEIIKNIEDAKRTAESIKMGKNSNGITIVREMKQGDLEFEDVMKSKLFPYLRGPDAFFEIVNNINMVPLENVMSIQFGIKTGANEFFYIKDVTYDYSDEKLKELFGLRKGEKDRVKVIMDGLGAVHLIENEYLKPILKGPKEFTKSGKLVFNEPTKKYVVLIEERNRNKIKKFALKYIEDGEKSPPGEPYSERKTCRARNPWWKLSPIEIPEIAFADQMSSTFLYPKVNTLLDKKLYLGRMNEENRTDLITVYSFMNSSLSYLYPDLYGRPVGGGSTAMAVFEYQRLPVPNPNIMRPYYTKLSRLMVKIEGRRIGSVFEEIWNMEGEFNIHSVKEDRLELDRTILKALGFDEPDKFLLSYYPSIVRIVKERLDKAKSVKVRNKKGTVSLTKVVDEIIQRINIKQFPQDYVSNPISVINIKKGKNVALGMDLEGAYLSIDGKKEYYDSRELAKYVYYCALRGIDSVPVPKHIKSTLAEFEEDLEAWKNQINEEVDGITDIVKQREKLFSLCTRKLNYSMLLK